MTDSSHGTLDQHVERVVRSIADLVATMQDDLQPLLHLVSPSGHVNVALPVGMGGEELARVARWLVNEHQPPRYAVLVSEDVAELVEAGLDFEGQIADLATIHQHLISAALDQAAARATVDRKAAARNRGYPTGSVRRRRRLEEGVE
jgi:hypothetical protein